MMLRRLALLPALLLALVLPGAAPAQEDVVLGLSQNRIAITANFDGSELLIFGAVKRETAIPETPLDVIVTLAGPSEPVTIHRKSRRLGIWVNTSSVEVDRAPSFYAVATSGPLDEVLTQTEDLRHAVSIPRAVRSVGATIEGAQSYTEALIRLRERTGAYQMLENEVQVDQQTLFRTNVVLPANLTEGAYSARIFLTREGRVLSRFDTVIDVRKVGLERWLYVLAQEQALAYGLLSLVIAIAAGWGASTAFRLLRG